MTGARVVVVDDAPANLLLLANVLQEAGYEVRVANSAHRALTLIERQPPDLILLDINLPDRDGYSVCEELKRNRALHAIPVIFLSAHDDAAAKRRGFEAGAVEYIAKPFDAAEVLARVALHLRTGAALREAETLRAELDLWRSRAEATFAALCATLTGAILDSRYRLDARLSADSSGALFLATDVTTGEAVGIRVLPPAPGICARLPRLRDSASLSGQVSHPNIKEMLDCGVSAAQAVPYTVTAPWRGTTLRERLDQRPRPNAAEARSIACQVAEALRSAHGIGTVHGCLCPERVFIETGPPPTVVLMDFRITAIDDEIRRDGYQAPERGARQAFEPAADVYALGIMLGELFGLEAPRDLVEVVAKAHDRDPANRPSAAELAEALSSRSS